MFPAVEFSLVSFSVALSGGEKAYNLFSCNFLSSKPKYAQLPFSGASYCGVSFGASAFYYSLAKLLRFVELCKVSRGVAYYSLEQEGLRFSC